MATGDRLLLLLRAVAGNRSAEMAETLTAEMEARVVVVAAEITTPMGLPAAREALEAGAGQWWVRRVRRHTH